MTADSIVRTAVLPRFAVRSATTGRVLATIGPSSMFRCLPFPVTTESYLRLRELLGPTWKGVPTWEQFPRSPEGQGRTMVAAEDVKREVDGPTRDRARQAGHQVVAVQRRHTVRRSRQPCHRLPEQVSAEELRTRKDEGYRLR